MGGCRGERCSSRGGYLSKIADPKRPCVRGAAGAASQGSGHLADLDLGGGAGGGARHAVGLHRLGIAARRHHRDRRLQPAEALLVDDGGAGARRHPGAGLCRRGGGRAGLRAGARRGALRGGRGPGAGRQDPVGARTGCRSSRRWSTTSQGAARLRPQPICIDRRHHRRRPRGAGARMHRRGWLDARDRDRQGLGHLDHPLHVGDHRAIEGRRAVGRGLHRRRHRHGGVRQADRPRRGAGLSAARLGRRPLSQLRAGPDRRLLHGLPGKRRHRRCRTCARSGRRSTSRRRASSRDIDPRR